MKYLVAAICLTTSNLFGAWSHDKVVMWYESQGQDITNNVVEVDAARGIMKTTFNPPHPTEAQQSVISDSAEAMWQSERKREHNADIEQLSDRELAIAKAEIAEIEKLRGMIQAIADAIPQAATALTNAGYTAADLKINTLADWKQKIKDFL